MFLKQDELFAGLRQEAHDILGRFTMKESRKRDEVLFREGEEARCLYILESGQVNIFLGRKAEFRFLVTNAGELFGWSAIVEPRRYIATARCVTDCVLSRVDGAVLGELARTSMADALRVYQNLASMLGERLVSAYRMNEGEPRHIGYGG